MGKSVATLVTPRPENLPECRKDELGINRASSKPKGPTSNMQAHVIRINFTSVVLLSHCLSSLYFIPHSYESIVTEGSIVGLADVGMDDFEERF